MGWKSPLVLQPWYHRLTPWPRPRTLMLLYLAGSRMEGLIRLPLPQSRLRSKTGRSPRWPLQCSSRRQSILQKLPADQRPATNLRRRGCQSRAHPARPIQNNGVQHSCTCSFSGRPSSPSRFTQSYSGGAPSSGIRSRRLLNNAISCCRRIPTSRSRPTLLFRRSPAYGPL